MPTITASPEHIIDRTELHAALLAESLDTGATLLRAVRDRFLATPYQASLTELERAAVVYDRATRAIRRAIVLEQRLMAGTVAGPAQPATREVPISEISDEELLEGCTEEEKADFYADMPGDSLGGAPGSRADHTRLDVDPDDIRAWSGPATRARSQTRHATQPGDAPAPSPAAPQQAAATEGATTPAAPNDAATTPTNPHPRKAGSATPARPQSPTRPQPS